MCQAGSDREERSPKNGSHGSNSPGKGASRELRVSAREAPVSQMVAMETLSEGRPAEELATQGGTLHGSGGLERRSAPALSCTRPNIAGRADSDRPEADRRSVRRYSGPRGARSGLRSGRRGGDPDPASHVRQPPRQPPPGPGEPRLPAGRSRSLGAGGFAAWKPR